MNFWGFSRPQSSNEIKRKYRYLDLAREFLKKAVEREGEYDIMAVGNLRTVP